MNFMCITYQSQENKTIQKQRNQLYHLLQHEISIWK